MKDSLLPFNKLTPAEAERLALLAEECGECVQAIGKILRHGYENFSPFDMSGTTNREALERECGDVRCAITRLCDEGDLYSGEISKREREKMKSVLPYLHHQQEWKDAVEKAIEALLDCDAEYDQQRVRSPASLNDALSALRELVKEK